MIENAEIVGYDIATSEYLKAESKRGTAEYRYSRSDLVQISECPHKWLMGGEDKQSKSLDWGELIDDLLLYGGKNVAVQPATYENSKGEIKPWHNGAKACKKWNLDHSDWIVISQEQMDEAQQAIDIMRRNETAVGLLDKCGKQAMVTGETEVNGQKVLIKCLIDIIPNRKGEYGRYLADLKTTATARLHQWTRSIYSYGYHVQAALCLDLWNAATGENRDMFCHLIQESAYPHETVVRALDEQWLSMGRDAYKRAMRRACECLDTGIWYGYDVQGDPHAVHVDGMRLVGPESWMVIE